jgi:hypothetical protein
MSDQYSLYHGHKTYLKAAQNMPMPKIVNPVPGKSSFLIVSLPSLCFGVVSFGTVKAAMILVQKYTIASKKKPALQLKIWVNNPDNMVPKTKPMGFPALKQPNALFFLGLGLS